MAELHRTAKAVWQGDLRSGSGKITTPSGVLQDDAYSFLTRFENAPGTNPEELVIAAHAACFSMAFSSALGKKGYKPERLETQGTLIMEQAEAGWTVSRVRLEVVGTVPNMNEAEFQQIAEEAEKGCPISRLLRPGLKEVVVVAHLK